MPDALRLSPRTLNVAQIVAAVIAAFAIFRLVECPLGVSALPDSAAANHGTLRVGAYLYLLATSSDPRSRQTAHTGHRRSTTQSSTPRRRARVEALRSTRAVITPSRPARATGSPGESARAEPASAALPAPTVVQARPTDTLAAVTAVTDLPVPTPAAVAALAPVPAPPVELPAEAPPQVASVLAALPPIPATPTLP
jgi:hypothetical protein